MGFGNKGVVGSVQVKLVEEEGWEQEGLWVKGYRR